MIEYDSLNEPLIEKERDLLNFDKAISLAGGFGRFQFVTAINFMIIFITNQHIF